MMTEEEKLQRLNKFMKLVESSQWVPSRKEYPPVLTDEDEKILTKAWKEVALENAAEEANNSINQHLDFQINGDTSLALFPRESVSPIRKLNRAVKTPLLSQYSHSVDNYRLSDQKTRAPRESHISILSTSSLDSPLLQFIRE